MNKQRWSTIRQATNSNFAYWRRFRNYLAQIEEIMDKPYTIPDHTFNQILHLSTLALQGDGEALQALKSYPDRVRELWYKEK